MANEVTVAASLSYADANSSEQLAQASFTYTPATLRKVKLTQTVNTSETTVNLGGVSTPGFVEFVNRDPTNYVELKVAASGAIFAKLHPAGGTACLFLGSGAQAPVAVANSAACLVEVMVTPA